MKEKIYICECGKTFDNPQKFNGHKRHCLIHAEELGKLEKIKAADKVAANKASAIASLKRKEEAENALQIWIDEKHTCKRCGKVMTEKWGSGTFCSRSCSNSRNNSGPQKQTIEVQLSKLAERKLIYEANPKRCIVCGNVLSYAQRYRVTCSDECCQIRQTHKNVSKKEHVGKHVVGRHIVYKIINDFDDRYYIGVRKTNNDELDTYLGSGIHISNMVKYYGRQHFSRITLFEFDNSTDAYNKEKELLVDALKDPKCVNLAHGGQGGCTFIGRKHSDATKQLLREKSIASHAKRKKQQSLSS